MVYELLKFKYNFNMKNNKGFAPVLILIIVIIGIVGGVAYYVGKSSEKVPNVEENNLAQENQSSISKNSNNNQKSVTSSYIGLTYPPYPEGVIGDINKDKYLGGSVIMKMDYSSTPYNLQVVKTPKEYELWLGYLINENNDEIPEITIIDSLLIPKEEILSFIFGGFCGKKDSLSPNDGLALDHTIIARVDTLEYYSKGRAPALFAWKTNLETGKIEIYSPDDIICITATPPGYID